MSEQYTPTTEEIRDAWADGHSGLAAEFDRWLAEVKAQAWEEGLLSMKSRLSIWPKSPLLPDNPYRQGEN